ncbi:MAG TPA: hypothetical protein VJA94_01410 [Candidatus Angelobacter sp.]
MESDILATHGSQTGDVHGIRKEGVIVDAVCQAYLQSCTQQPTPRAKQFKKHWEEQVQARANPSDSVWYTKVMHFANQARQSALRGEIANSCKSFGRAHNLLASEALSAECKLRCQSDLAAAEAYLDYYCGDFEQAKRRLVEAMVADQALEDHYGYKFLHAHRIHLVNNTIKVEVHASRLPEAMKLAGNVFLYLMEKASSLPMPTAWGPEYACHLDLETRRFLTSQLAGEVAAATAGLKPAIVREALRTLFGPLNINETHEAFHPEIQTWLRLKELSIEDEEILTYLESCASYFALGPRSTAYFWHLTALDVANACESIHATEADLLRREAARELMKSGSLPRHLRKMLGQILKQMGAELQEAAAN